MSILSKSIAAGAAFGMLHGASAPVFAGPYVNIENNAAWQGSERCRHHVHAVMSSTLGSISKVVLLRLLTAKKPGNSARLVSGLSEKLELYGEVSFMLYRFQYEDWTWYQDRSDLQLLIVANSNLSNGGVFYCLF